MTKGTSSNQMIHIDNISHLRFDFRAAENEKVLKRRPPASQASPPSPQ